MPQTMDKDPEGLLCCSPSESLEQRSFLESILLAILYLNNKWLRVLLNKQEKIPSKLKGRMLRCCK